MTNQEKEILKLIDRLYKDLYLDESVIHHGSGNKYDKFNNIKMYLKKLEDIHNKISDTGRHKELLQEMYYDKYVIKAEDIPESYYEHQEEIALERGYGYIEITDDEIERLEEEVIGNKKYSLKIWLDYFLSKDSKIYPFWAKYWAFQGMLKLGNYDKEKGEFVRRTKNTVAPFPDLNREALAISIDMITKILNREKIEDKELGALVKSGSFGKIYSYVLNHILKDNIIKRNIGRWVKYNQGSDHMPLVNSLKGYNTGWCTAGEFVARDQLTAGDFYVYYTLDENDEYKVPRIAIRMEYNKIAEIRGIAKDQNLEPEMEEVVEEKIKDFPDKEEYYKKVNDMKLLTRIYKKYQKSEELTKEELRFIYEIDNEILGFGYEKDPRIEEIINERDVKEDLSFVLNCKQNQIATFGFECDDDTIYCYDDFDTAHYDKDIKFPRYVNGDLTIHSIRNFKDVVLPESVGGDLYLNNIDSIEGLVLPKRIRYGLHFCNLKSVKGLKLPNKINYDLDFELLGCDELLTLPQIIEGNLELHKLKEAKNLVLPYTIYGNLHLNSLIDAEGLVFPEIVSGELYLSKLKSAKNVVLPHTVGEELDLSELESAEGLILPENLGSGVYLDNLKSAKGLVLPEELYGDLNLSSLTCTEGLVLPNMVDGYLNLNSLVEVKELILPNYIGENIYLKKLKKVERLVLPEEVEEILYLESLESLDGVILPEQLTYDIRMKNFEITPENVHEYINNKIYKK